eukprot:Skav200904  [mRNA]  locus=scaffold1581:332424:334331:+ [translate_table: standard]
MLSVDQDDPPLVGQSRTEERARKTNVAVCMYLFFARAVQYAIASRDFLDTYILDISGSNEKVGQIESICGIAALVILMPCGYLADRCRRLTLLRFLAVAKALPTLMAFVSVRQKNLILLQVNGPFEQVLQVFLVDNSLPEQRTLFLSRKEMLSWLGTAVGPLLALLLVNLHADTGWSVPLLQNVICAGLIGFFFVEPAVLLLRNASPSAKQTDASASALAPWTQEVKCGVRKQWLVPVWTEIMWGATQIAGSLSLKYVPLFFRKDFSMSPSGLMILRVAENLSLAAMNWATPVISAKMGRAWAAILFIFSGGLLMLGVAATLHQTWLAATLFILRTTFARANVPCVQSIIFESVLPKHRGRWTDACAWLGGYLADRTGDYRAGFVLTGGIHMLCAVCYVPMAFLVP